MSFVPAKGLLVEAQLKFVEAAQVHSVFSKYRSVLEIPDGVEEPVGTVMAISLSCVEGSTEGSAGVAAGVPVILIAVPVESTAITSIRSKLPSAVLSVRLVCG